MTTFVGLDVLRERIPGPAGTFGKIFALLLQ